MAKKKHRKKQQLKYAAPVKKTIEPAASKSVESMSTAKQTSSGTKSVKNAVNDDFGYVTKDLRRVGMLAASFVVLMLILWYGFNHTGLGPAVYRLIKL